MQMTLSRPHRRILLAAITIASLVAGCDSDQRVVELSRESLNRQAEQNHEMARQNQAVTATTQQLIKSETDVQHDASQPHEQLHTERSALDQQRQDLAGERRSLADERQRDSILGQAIPGIVAIVVAALPLVVCWYLARSRAGPCRFFRSASRSRNSSRATPRSGVFWGFLGRKKRDAEDPKKLGRTPPRRATQSLLN
jgi:hypothetical protein